MNSPSHFLYISSLLSDWYKNNKRDLPWRNTKDPYPIWISEIILQQTRVDQGLPYFESIINRFPNVNTLAESPLDELLKFWQGLGYYSRARNMHTAAKQVVEQYEGRFPDSYEKLRQLKGVGEYTAAAIASFAFHLPHAVLDGNVYRVLSRLFTIDTPINTTEGKKIFSSFAEELLDKKNPEIHNQAIMDFGALQCIPNKPNCVICPLSDHCMAYIAGKVSELPVKIKAAKKRHRYFHYFFLTDGKSTWLRQRTENDIWQQLWEFPLIECETEIESDAMLLRKDVSGWMGENAKISNPISLRHILTHQIIHATFYTIKISLTDSIPEKWKKIHLAELDTFAVSKLTETFIEKHIKSYL
jgi:A/G-specific adenine glycosylase